MGIRVPSRNKQTKISRRRFSKIMGEVFLPDSGINQGSLTRISALTTQVSQETPLTFLHPYPEMGYSRRQKPCVDVSGQMGCTWSPGQTQPLCQHKVSGGVENTGLPAWDGALKRDTQSVSSHAFGTLYVAAAHTKSALDPETPNFVLFCLFFWKLFSKETIMYVGIGRVSVAFSEMSTKLK